MSTLRKGLSLKCFYIPAVQLVCSEALLCMYAYGDGSSEEAYTLTCITVGATIYRSNKQKIDATAAIKAACARIIFAVCK